MHPNLALRLPAFVILMVVGVWSSANATRTDGVVTRLWGQREGVAIRSILGALLAARSIRRIAGFEIRTDVAER